EPRVASREVIHNEPIAAGMGDRHVPQRRTGTLLDIHAIACGLVHLDGIQSDAAAIDPDAKVAATAGHHIARAGIKHAGILDRRGAASNVDALPLPGPARGAAREDDWRARRAACIGAESAAVDREQAATECERRPRVNGERAAAIYAKALHTVAGAL